jgi:hypothetical protein
MYKAFGNMMIELLVVGMTGKADRAATDRDYRADRDYRTGRAGRADRDYRTGKIGKADGVG